MRVLTIALVDLKRIARDRTALFFTLALPLIIILVIGLVTQRFEEATMPVGITGPTDTPLAAELAERIDTGPAVELQRFADADALRRAVRRGVVAAGIVVPDGYDQTLLAGGEARIGFVVDRTRTFPGALRALVAGAASEQGSLVQAAVFAAQHTGTEAATTLRVAREAAELDNEIGVDTRTLGTDREPVTFGTGFGYQAPANLVLFVFITSLAAAGQLIETRRLGITRRVLGTPVTARTVLAGQTLGRFAIAFTQAVLIYAAGAVIFGVDWGDPLAAGALILAFVLVGTAVGMLFGTVFRTAEQAGSVGPPVGIALGMLGGCMWPLEVVGDGMRAFGHLFPHAWAMDAWIQVTAYGGGVASILPELGVLLAYTGVLLPVAVWRLRRSVLHP